MLGAAEPDARGAEPTRAGSVGRRVGVGADVEPAALVRVVEQECDGRHEVVLDGSSLQPPHHRGVDDGNGPGEDLAGRPVERDKVAFTQLDVADADDA